MRFSAQELADSMQNFTATETFAWGRGSRGPDMTDAFETLIVDGRQRWRRDGAHKFYDRVPVMADDKIVSGGEWAWLPQMVGTVPNLRIHQAPDAVIGGKNIHVFQYAASVEDKLCLFEYEMFFGIFMHASSRLYDCHGEVWMDESGVILRISEDVDLTGPLYRWHGVMTYGWLEKDGRRHLVPITVTTQAERSKTADDDHKPYWCRILFTDYQMFGVKSRMISPAVGKAPRSADAEVFHTHLWHPSQTLY